MRLVQIGRAPFEEREDSLKVGRVTRADLRRRFRALGRFELRHRRGKILLPKLAVGAEQQTQPVAAGGEAPVLEWRGPRGGGDHVARLSVQLGDPLC